MISRACGTINTRERHGTSGRSGTIGPSRRAGIKPLKQFARRLSAKIEGIIYHCLYPLHTSLLEGINNKIKVIKRMAYGFRDEAYFFLKIRDAFPGIPG